MRAVPVEPGMPGLDALNPRIAARRAVAESADSPLESVTMAGHEQGYQGWEP